MSNIVISIENLSKSYRLGQISGKTLSDDLKVWWARQRGKPNPLLEIGQQDYGNREGETVWALKDVSFTVEQGEVLGIIGRNGAGKSTLLKILSRVTAPTTGQVKVSGRIASLLEVGTGFHPDLTGRENIYLNGAILGMSKTEVDRKFEEIVDFSGIETYINTPVKRYSSGMYVRLAFAVAAHLDPEILIVDEVLAVGDAGFQKKCLGKMGDVAKSGRTILFVSHNMTAIQSLCKQVMWIDNGIVCQKGVADEVVTEYLHTAYRSVMEKLWPDRSIAPGNDRVRFRSARIVLAEQAMKNFEVITVETPLDIEFEYWNMVPDLMINLSLHLYNLEGTCVLNVGTMAKRYPIGLIRAVCHIPGNFLNDETYRIMIMAVQDQSFAITKVDDILIFEVREIERTGGWHGKWGGLVRPTFEWKEEFVSSIL